MLTEFLRVLRPGGEALISTPDLQGVAAVIATGRLHERLYRSEAGDISALDVVYGAAERHRGRPRVHGPPHRLHGENARPRPRGQAGFVRVQASRAADYALWARGFRAAILRGRLRRNALRRSRPSPCAFTHDQIERFRTK